MAVQLLQGAMELINIHTFTFSSLFVVLLCLFLMKKMVTGKGALQLPPGPAGLPIIGNMHQLGKLPHHTLRRMAQTYGPLVFLRLGRVPTLVVSSPDMAKEVLKTHDLAFCSRPPLLALRKLTYSWLDMAFAPYGEYWKQVRKICMMELFSSMRVQSFRSVREEEVGILVDTISRSSTFSVPVNLNDMFFCLLNNITCRAVLGRRYSEAGECQKSPFHDMVTESLSLLGTLCTGDFIPYTEWLNRFTGLQTRIDKNFAQMNALLEEVIEVHRSGSSLETKQNDLVDFVLQIEKEFTTKIPLTRDHIKAILMDLFLAGTDTTSAALEWTMTELMKNPRIMKKAKAEVRNIMGKKEKVDEGDLHQFQYLKQVIKEVLRFHPPGPFLIPRETREECAINGYDIPIKTMVFVNVWAIGRDPKFWENPNDFWPERFTDSSINFKGQDFQLIPFGAGRRGCPGLSMGATTVELTIANLLHIFDWELPGGISLDEIDMEGTAGPAIHKKIPLLLVAKREMTLE